MSKVIGEIIEKLAAPTGMEINSSLLERSLNRSALSALVRPTDAWFAGVQGKLNKFGIDMDVFSAYKNIDRGLQSATALKDSLAEGLGKLLPSSEHSAPYAEVLAWPEETWAHHAETLGLDSSDLARIRGIKEWDSTFKEKTGNSLLDGLKVIHEARSTGLTPEGEGFWHSALLRHAISPEDFKLDRIAGFGINRSVMNMFTDEPIKALEELTKVRGKNGEFVLGPAIPAMQSYMNMVQGIPHQSDRLVKAALQMAAEGWNKVVRIPGLQVDPDAKNILQKFLTLTSSAAVGARPALFIRDLFENFKAMAVMGPTAFTRGIERAMTPEGFEASNVVALHGKNINEYLSAITDDSLIGKWSKVAEAMMAPARWGNNIGRRAVYLGEVERSLGAIAQYRSGAIDADALIQRTGLWFHDAVPRSRLVAMASGDMPIHQVADEFGRQMVDSTLYSLRYGNQPQSLRTSAGRVFGQFGQWPVNYIEFARKLGARSIEFPTRGGAALAAFGAAQYAARNVAESLGVDISNWLFTAPAAYLPSPVMELAGNIAASPQEPSARRRAIEQALTFSVPGGVQLSNVFEAWKEGDLSMQRLLGFKELKPQDELDLQNWFIKQAGYSPR